MEWGCMQALIDFDGWRKWKDLSDLNKTATPKKTTINTKITPKECDSNLTKSVSSGSPSTAIRHGNARSSSPTLTRSGKPNGTTPPLNGAASAGGNARNRKPPSVNGVNFNETKVQERSTSSEADTGTGTDTNGDENSGAEISVGA